MTDIPVLIDGQLVVTLKQDHYCEDQYRLAPEVACDIGCWELSPDAARWPEPSPGHDLDVYGGPQSLAQHVALLESPIAARQRIEREAVDAVVAQALALDAAGFLTPLHLDIRGRRNGRRAWQLAITNAYDPGSGT